MIIKLFDRGEYLVLVMYSPSNLFLEPKLRVRDFGERHFDEIDSPVDMRDRISILDRPAYSLLFC